MQLVHVMDLAAAILLAGARPEAADEVYNIAGAEAPTLREMASIIRACMGRAGSTATVPDPSRHWRRYVVPYNTTKAERRLAWAPRVAIREGLAELLGATGQGG
jgi:nucleoside-diphosphate-sugar epimerase